MVLVCSLTALVKDRHGSCRHEHLRAHGQILPFSSLLCQVVKMLGMNTLKHSINIKKYVTLIDAASPQT